MSLLEQTIWNMLGYGAMPFIFLSGFVAVAVTCCLLLQCLRGQVRREVSHSVHAAKCQSQTGICVCSLLKHLSRP